MEFYSFEKIVLAIIVVIVTWLGCLAIIKWIWSPVERWFGSMVENREPILILQENPELVNAVASASLPSAPAEPSSTAGPWKYDVFMSFRGLDTRKGIVFELYDGLQRRGIKTFKDDRDLEVGDAISPTLLAAIEESRFAIVVLSEKYASSTWCLDELAKICECMKHQNRILPLFYHVEPSDVRYRKRSFGEAFTKHETSGRHRSEKLQQWRDALKQVASFSGWHTQNFQTERELVEDIVKYVFSKVPIESNMGDFVAFEATRKAMDEIMKALNGDKVIAVGVYGMGGVGKTTMVKQVGAQACRNGIFNAWIMAVVSQSPDLRKIQDALADLLGFKFEENSEIGRAARLSKEIMRREKILIILDDVWNRIELSDIGIPNYKELQNCNSKVLLTTRIWNVCHAMDCQEKVTLNILSEDDSLTLFARNARRYFESTDFHEAGRKVATECCGLPIALIAVAKALGDKDVVEWERAAQRLEKSQIANPDEKGVAFKCIKLSYDYLENEDYKSCFLLCCLFPEDYDIKIEDLFKYAIGKGLFQDADTILEARETTDTVLKYLKNSSLLLESERNRCVRMHDVIRDTAMHIAKSEDGHGFFVKAGSGLKDWPRRLHEGYTVISLMKNQIRKLPEELVCPKLQILLLQDNADLNEIPDTFFQSASESKVLDLSNTSISSLPQSFNLLTNLQVLRLDVCSKIIDFSILGKLKKLEILSMRTYPHTELSREIRHLTNLRMLDVSGYSGALGIVRIPSIVISKLHRLEELYMLNCRFENWGSKIEGEGEETNISFDELVGLSNLKILQVCISDAKCIPKYAVVEPNWVYFDICIGSRNKEGLSSRLDHNLRSLELFDTTIGTLPDWFVNVVTKKTEKLKYIRCIGLSNIIMEYDRGWLHGLKHLTVLGYHGNLKELMNITTRVQKGPVFEKLEELHLVKVDSLEELCVGELPPGSLFNLKLLNVHICHNLGNISKLLQRLPNLEILYLCCWGKMEYVFGYEGFEPEQSKLREMMLVGPRALRSIYNGLPPLTMFQNLKSLAIYSCKILQSVFTSDVAQCLFQLEDLFVGGCPLLERLVEAVNNKKLVLPKLKSLVLFRLPMLYSASGTLDIEYPSLEHLYLRDCPKFSFSTSASDYFHSRNQVQLNDEQHYWFQRNRWASVSSEKIY